MRITSFVAAVLAGASVWLSGSWALAEEPVPEVGAVDALQSVFGVHPGLRSNHAKGIVLEGTFTPTAEAKALSKASLFDGPPVKATVRFSKPTGNPEIADNDPSANPHGLAVKFALPDNVEMDMAMISTKTFPFGSVIEFRDFFRAIAATKPDSPKPTPVEAFIEAHPALKAWIAAKPTTPESFATESYYGLNAFRLVSASGEVTNVRFRFVPVAGEKRLSPEDLKARSATFLMDDIKARAAAGAAKFQLVAQVGGKDDPTNDVLKSWPEDRKLVTLGELSITTPASDSGSAEKGLVFLPTNLADGVEASDDPLIAARAGAYAESFSRRSN